ncbi:type II toxin-antitoxin system antitoxin DNA ADP-ribosyl glycohydrolase DarG [Frankia canadensis]|nr:macro domain-containing protein [Frankia canadensis]
MITEAAGNLLDADVDALVNTVNTTGVMGKGIALQFRRAYPAMFDEYQGAAKAGQIELGRVQVWPTGAMTGPRYVINFPTKAHWRSRSRLADVERGLVDLVRVARELGIRSLAVPPLGCGHGGLDWGEVEPRIRDALAALDPDVLVLLYPPSGPSAADLATTRARRPQMTPARAVVVRLINTYVECASGASLVEVQKLLYFLQVAGESLRLDFRRAQHGPYADNLSHALISLEGHYLVGFADGGARVQEAEPIRVVPGADALAAAVLSGHPERTRRLGRVLDLIEGFESAYGLELLAGVHWTVQENPEVREDPVQAARRVRARSPRKGHMFTDSHVRAAWTALYEQGWLAWPEAGAATEPYADGPVASAG